METLIKMDDLGVPLFSETPAYRDYNPFTTYSCQVPSGTPSRDPFDGQFIVGIISLGRSLESSLIPKQPLFKFGVFFNVM